MVEVLVAMVSLVSLNESKMRQAESGKGQQFNTSSFLSPINKNKEFSIFPRVRPSTRVPAALSGYWWMVLACGGVPVSGPAWYW